MKKRDVFSLIYQLAGPVSLALLGAVLILAPDLLSYLIAKFLGWGVLAVGVGFVLAAIFGGGSTVGKVLGALAAFAVGGWLTRHPLSWANQIGIFLGILLLLRGIRDFLQSRKKGKLLSIATIVVGVILLLSPLTATRLVFSLCGAGMIVIGIVMAVGKLKYQSYLEAGDDPDIIDAL